jgi:uncharacterized metal-binding protein
MGCSCCGGVKLIFSCSGAADVGELSDLAARKLNRENVGNMYCLAGVGGKVSGIVKTTEAADEVLVIDGCPINCAKKSMEDAGIEKFMHLQIGDLGFIKGKTEINEENINKVFDKSAEMLGVIC